MEEGDEVSTTNSFSRKRRLYNRWRTSLNMQWLLILVLAVASLIVKRYQPAHFRQFAVVFAYIFLTVLLKEILLRRKIIYFHRFLWFFILLNVSLVFAMYNLGHFPLNFLFSLYILLIFDSIGGLSHKELQLTTIFSSVAFLVNIIILWPQGTASYRQAGLLHLYILQGVGFFLSLLFIILAYYTALLRSRQAEDLIQNLEQLLHEKERNLKQLYEVNAALEEKYAASYTLSLIQQYLLDEMQDPKLLEKITDIIQGVSGSSVCAILGLREDQEAEKPGSRALQLLAVSGTKDPSALIRLLEDPASPTYRVLEEKNPSYERAASTEELALWNMLGIKSFFMIPLFTKEEEIGLLFVAHSQEGAFNRDQLEFLQLIANQLSLALENILLHQNTQELAWHDPLTGLYNRYYLNQYLAKQEEKYGSGLALGCIIFDLDHFKQVNDKYGHVTGDLVLKKVAAILRKHAETGEGWLAGRFGGEEFILLATCSVRCCRCQTPRLKQVADEIRKQIAETTFTSGDGKTFSLTISGGIACIPKHAKNTDEMFIKADEALYSAKRAGRNRIIVYSEPEESKG